MDGTTVMVAPPGPGSAGQAQASCPNSAMAGHLEPLLPLRDRKFVTLRWREPDSNPRSHLGG
jgi:hypothetical protein